MASFSDDFNRADSDPMSGSWAQDAIMVSDWTMAISSNRATRGSGGTTGGASVYYTGGDLGPDCTVEGDFHDGDTGNALRLFSRLASPGDSCTGYVAEIFDGANSCVIYRMDSGWDTKTSIGSAINADRAGGTRYRLECIGSEIKLYYFSGSWTQLVSATDSTYAAAGKVGFGDLVFTELENFQADDIGGPVLTAYPTTDSVDNSWTDQGGGTSLFAAIDETTPSDTDYIRSPVVPQSSGCRVKLGTLSDPVSSTGHIIHWRAAKSATGGDTINMTVKIYQGGGDSLGAGTLIADFDRNGVDAFTTYDETLSAGEANSITNYGDLYLEFWADVP